MFSYLRCFDAQHCGAFYRFVYTSTAHGASPGRVLYQTSDGGLSWLPNNAPVGGWSDCAEPSWCIQSASASSVFSFTTEPNQWPERDVPAVAQAVRLWPRPFVTCPIPEHCFFLGSSPTEHFIARLTKP